MNDQLKWAVFVSASLIATGAAGDSPAAAPTGKMQTLTQGWQSGIEARREVVVRDAGSFRALWAGHVAGRSPPPPLPAVDFSRELVVAVFAGAQPTGGYSLSPPSLEIGRGRTLVRFVLKRPGPNCLSTQVVTQPFAMVRIPKGKATVEIKVTETTVDC